MVHRIRFCQIVKSPLRGVPARRRPGQPHTSTSLMIAAQGATIGGSAGSVGHRFASVGSVFRIHIAGRGRDRVNRRRVCPRWAAIQRLRWFRAIFDFGRRRGPA